MKRTLQILIISFHLISTEKGKALDIGKVSIHGFASTGYMRSDHNNFLLASEDGSFEFNEVGINLGTAISENMRVGIQLYSFDLGDIGNNEISLDWAFLDYEWKEWLGLRVGKIKTPLGLYNETQDYDMLRTCILLPQSVYNKYLRETSISIQGMAIYGQIPLSLAGKWKYDLFLGTAGIDTDGGIAKSISGDGIEFKSATMKYLTGIRLRWFPPAKGLTLGGSCALFGLDYKATGSFDIPLGSGLSLTQPIDLEFTNDITYTYAFFIEYDIGKLTMAAEYLYSHYDTSLEMDYSQLGLPFKESHTFSSRFSAFYTLISYRLYSWLELGTYYSCRFPDFDYQSDDVESTMKDLALSARFDINPSWLIKAEVHFMGGTQRLTEADNPDGSYEPKWTLFAVKTTFSF